MSDHYNALIVTLEDDLSQENAQPLIDAIKQLRGVLSVDPHVRDVNGYVAQIRARTEVIEKLIGVIDELQTGK